MPPVGSTFDTKEPFLYELLEEIHQGAIQLPDFQRPWVWDDEHIRSLIASISESFPIGVVMLMETGGDATGFKPRPVEGVELAESRRPDQLILDGQQRLTSLYQSIRSGRPVQTRTDKKKPIERVYYLDMKQCLDPNADRVDAVVSVPADRVVRTDFGRGVVLDLSTRQNEFSAGYFPVALLFDHSGWMEWRNGYQAHFAYEAQKTKFISAFEQAVWHRFQQYKVPVISILKSMPKEAVCHVFEKVNTGGVSLTVFELVTATFAAAEFRLSDDWGDREKRLKAYDVLRDFDGTDFLTAVTLAASYKPSLARGTAPSCKRKDILKLPLTAYCETANAVEAGLVRAAKFLAKEKVFSAKELPYVAQLIPLGAIAGTLGNDFEDDAVKKQIAQWYWCGVFGELYGGANETRFGLDLQGVLGWLQSGELPKTVKDASFLPTRLLSMQSRLSAAYKGVMARLMQLGSLDFISGDPLEITTYFDDAVDIHHVFPEDYCEGLKLPREKWNSVVNKAPLRARTNRMIGGHAPSVYLGSIERKRKGVPVDDQILRSHAIDPAKLRADDFHGFIRDRASRLLDLIGNATGKEVQGRESDDTAQAFGGSLARA